MGKVATACLHHRGPLGKAPEALTAPWVLHCGSSLLPVDGAELHYMKRMGQKNTEKQQIPQENQNFKINIAFHPNQPEWAIQLLMALRLSLPVSHRQTFDYQGLINSYTETYEANALK